MSKVCGQCGYVVTGTQVQTVGRFSRTCATLCVCGLVLTSTRDNVHPTRLELPIITALRGVLDASPTGDLPFLVTAQGQPFTINGFGIRFCGSCDKAGLPHCSVHGLRKAAAARLAEPGCTAFEIMAITDHQPSKELNFYRKAASQKTKAASALVKLTAEWN